jgi:hypothetical protein
MHRRHRRRLAPARAVLRAAVVETLERRTLLSTPVTTYHNDLASSGQNVTETTLTPLNVSTSVFGKKFTTSVDGQVYAQPLYVPGQNITIGANQGVHNVVYVATEHDSLYAIDANNGTILWQDSFILPEAALQAGGTVTVTTVPNGDVNSSDINPQIGITGTPVIDQATGFLFLVAKTKQVVNNVTTSPHYVQVLYKVSLADGTFTSTVIGDTTNTSGTYTYNVGPYVLDAHAQGAGHVTATINGSSKVVVYFNALRQHNRGALLLNNGNVYIPFASHGDNTPYHGWILGYSESTLAPSAVLNLNPDGSDDGVWEGGGRIAMDPQGYMYVETGNGTFDTTLAAKTGFNIGFPQYGDYGDSFVKIGLDPTTNQSNQNINGWGLQVVDYFTPQNQASLSSADQDLGSGGPLILPDSVGSASHPHLLIGSGKGGVLYLIDRDNMGEFHSSTDSIVQEVAGGLSAAGSYGTAAFFNDGTTSRIYYGGKSDNLKAFTISSASLNTTPAKSPDTFGLQGDTPSISANGSSNGVVWAIDGGSSQLRAYNVTPSGSPAALQEIYTSGQNSARDALGTAVKFTAPTVADGQVFVGTSSTLVAYGQIASPTSPPSTPGTLVANDANNVQINLSWGASSNTPFGYYVELSADGGTSWTQIASVGTSSYTVAGLQPGATYSFRVRAYNSLGNSGYSNVASATTSNPSAVPNFPSGFSSGNGLLTINGSTAYTGTVLELTNGGGGEASSAFTSNAVSVQGFTTTFTFLLSSATADGFTFCIQGVGPTALGAGGGSLGYQGINNSVAVKFDLYPSLSTTGLYTGGAAPDDTMPPAIDMSAAGINLHSGDIMQATFTYDGVNLVETVKDTSTNATFTHTYPINIPAAVGSGFAFVGFTGATGGSTAIQDIQTWTYTPVLAAPYTPATLTVTPASGTELDLAWTEPYSSVTTFNILKLIGLPAGWPSLRHNFQLPRYHPLTRRHRLLRGRRVQRGRLVHSRRSGRRHDSHAAPPRQQPPDLRSHQQRRYPQLAEQRHQCQQHRHHAPARVRLLPVRRLPPCHRHQLR